MKLLLLLVALSCWAAPSVLARNFVCYFPSWASNRGGGGEFGVEQINLSLCTHVVYAFAVLDPEFLTIQSGDPYLDITQNGYKNFTDLKRKNPSLKTMLAIGGWVDSNMDDPINADKYSALVSDQDNIKNFVESVVTFLETYGFDGLDMDWEYPRNDDDKKGFNDLMKELYGRFQNQQPEPLLILSAAIPASKEILAAGYDMREVDRHVDFLNLMSYDMHGSWEPDTADHHAPLSPRDGDNGNNIKDVVDYLIDAEEVTALKINLGIPTYGRTWTLTSDVVTPPCAASGEGDAGPITGEPGILAYNEICKGIKDGAWVKETDDIGPYAYTDSNPKQWVGYDDIESVKVKSNYAVERKLGGAMVWDMAMDDFKNVCNDGVNPLMTVIAVEINKP